MTPSSARVGDHISALRAVVAVEKSLVVDDETRGWNRHLPLPSVLSFLGEWKLNKRKVDLFFLIIQFLMSTSLSVLPFL